MYGYVYITTNLINGKRYIGQHSSETINDEYLGSGRRFVNALKKYGKENFSKEILVICDSKEELDYYEMYYINLFDARNSADFYNLSVGGEASTKGNIFIHNIELNECLSVSPERYEKEFRDKGYEIGQLPRTDEQRQHYRDCRRDLVPITDGIKTIYVHKSELDDYVSNGFRIGRNKASRPNQKQEARRWMNNGEISKMVKPEDFEEYLSNGFTFGRGSTFTPNISGFTNIITGIPQNKGKKLVIIDGKRHYR